MGAGRLGCPTCTAPMAITHMQNRKMPRGTSGKVTIKENCSQEHKTKPGPAGPRSPVSLPLPAYTLGRRPSAVPSYQSSVTECFKPLKLKRHPVHESSL